MEVEYEITNCSRGPTRVRRCQGKLIGATKFQLALINPPAPLAIDSRLVIRFVLPDQSRFLALTQVKRFTKTSATYRLEFLHLTKEDMNLLETFQKELR